MTSPLVHFSRRRMLASSVVAAGAAILETTFAAAEERPAVTYPRATSGDDALPPGPAAAFPAFSRRRAGLLNLQLRHGLGPEGLAAVLGIPAGSAAIVAERTVSSAEADLGDDATTLLEGYARATAATDGFRWRTGGSAMRRAWSRDHIGKGKRSLSGTRDAPFGDTS